jgi:hypothetical protein
VSTVVDIADAVVASLNGATFSQAVSAERKYVPAVDLADLADLHVTVVPRAVAITTATRDSSYFDCSVDVGIQQKVNPDDVAELDALVNLTQEVVDHLRMRRLESMPYAAWMSIANDPVFAPEHLDQERAFTSVVSVTYRVRR